jgi:hypothetical protein
MEWKITMLQSKKNFLFVKLIFFHSQISSTFKQFLERGKEERIQQEMSKDDNWSKISKPEYHKMITSVAMAACKSHPSEMNEIFDFLFPYLKGNFVEQRLVAATVLAEFINHCKVNIFISYFLFDKYFF